jgi:hypothetical protein
MIRRNPYAYYDKWQGTTSSTWTTANKIDCQYVDAYTTDSYPYVTPRVKIRKKPAATMAEISDLAETPSWHIRPCPPIPASNNVLPWEEV